MLAAGGSWLRAGVTALHEGGCGDVVVVLGAAVVEVPPPARGVVAGGRHVELAFDLAPPLTRTIFSAKAWEPLTNGAKYPVGSVRRRTA